MSRKAWMLVLLAATGCSTQAGMRAKVSRAMAANQIQEHAYSLEKQGDEVRLNNECDSLSQLEIFFPDVWWVSDEELTKVFGERRDPTATDAATIKILFAQSRVANTGTPGGDIAVALLNPPRERTGTYVLVYQWHCPKAAPPAPESLDEPPPGH